MIGIISRYLAEKKLCPFKTHVCKIEEPTVGFCTGCWVHELIILIQKQEKLAK